MIKFSGRVSHEVKKKILKQRDRQIGWMALGVSLVLSISTVLYSVFDQSVKYELLTPTLVIMIITIILLIAPQTNRSFRFDWTYTVSIEGGKIYKRQNQQPDIIKEISKIKKVIDDGDWYTVIYSGLSNAIICQKDLLVEGTLEEFEALFEGKIKRRCKKK